MILNSRACETLRRAVLADQNRPIPLDKFDQFTLPGLLDLLASAAGMPARNPFVAHFERAAAEGNSLESTCWRDWNQPETGSLGTDIHGVRAVEFYRLRMPVDQINARHQLFLERFVRSLELSGFAKGFSYALAGAFAEMTDNVVQHSRSDPGELSGFARYHVSDRYMSFGVFDLGQGVLTSLKRSPAWQHLQTPGEALRAAVCGNATSRADQQAGDGFRTVFRSLADRNGLLRFRSENASLTITDAGHARQGVEMTSPPLCGLQLSVCCSLDTSADERAIETV